MVDKSKLEGKGLKEDFGEDLLEGDNFAQLPKELSDHVLMQWHLIELGLKSKSNVWVPKNDQKKIKEEYQFYDFEEEFSTGIDVPIKYVKNIDCIWKEEFKINAAFEVENTTDIYSGLLRFSDLKIVAPNSKYPMFIVAPSSKKNKLIEQMKRPTFKRLELHKDVKFLSYENLRSISDFFSQSPRGMNLEVLDSKAEEIKI